MAVDALLLPGLWEDEMFAHQMMLTPPPEAQRQCPHRRCLFVGAPRRHCASAAPACTSRYHSAYPVPPYESYVPDPYVPDPLSQVESLSESES